MESCWSLTCPLNNIFLSLNPKTLSGRSIRPEGEQSLKIVICLSLKRLRHLLRHSSRSRQFLRLCLMPIHNLVESKSWLMAIASGLMVMLVIGIGLLQENASTLALTEAQARATHEEATWRAIA